MEQQTLFHKIIKISLIAIIFITISILGYLAGGIVKYGIDIRKSDKVTENFQNALEQPYKDDVYGGKTPEETWSMYLNALKDGDIELASRYYAVGDQEKHNQALSEGQQRDNLKLYLEQLSSPLQKDESLPDFILANKEKAYYYYIIKDIETDEIIKNNVKFYLNPYTKVWKILR